jgi:CheY-like chemotaxis protein/HPt (histidine-containing phosphotransfer) domain-containing protein
MAEDGQSALFNSQKNHYDVIILDLNMPLLDGLELSHKIRSSTNPNQFCPILIISANLDLLSAEKIKQAGINECLQKPFSETSLQHKIKLLLNPATTEPVNWHKLTKQVSGKIAVAEEILQQFLVELDENALLLEMALLKNDFKNALEMTHKLLGGSQFCALDKLSHILHELESLFKIETSCTPQLFMLFGQLKLIHHTLKLRIPLTSLAS